MHLYKQITSYLAWYSILATAWGCNFTGAQDAKSVKDSLPSAKKDSIKLAKPYSSLTYDTAIHLTASAGTKSVLFNTQGSKLYAMNLEALSVYEFDQASKQVNKIYKFKPTKGIGWDYVTHQPVPSYEEKPVEACLSHNDKILWVSLHNAAGVVPIKLDSVATTKSVKGKSKKLYMIDKKQHRKDSMQVPLIATGKTPKVISRTADSKYLLVSNWHSNSVSVLEMNDTSSPYGKVIKTIPVSAIPRGIVVNDKNNKSYVAIMGGRTISVVDNTTWTIEKNIEVASTPRHIVMDTSGHLFVSYNSLGKIGCIEAATGKTLFTASTNTQPRTIVLSKNHQFLFVTCYTGNTVDVFKVNKNSFTKLYSLECKGKPVGVDVYEDDATLEAWVCNYVGGSLKVFSFKKQ